jgi:hypothetical protein
MFDKKTDIDKTGINTSNFGIGSGKRNLEIKHDV